MTALKDLALSAERLKYDLHSHLLPDVDDGVRNWEEALQAIESLIGLGYSGAVTTPHIYAEVFNNSEERLRSRFAELCDRAHARFPDFHLNLGAEYYLDEQLIGKILCSPSNLLSVGDQGRWILIELSMVHPCPNVDDLLLSCRRQNLQPIIAHPERYDSVQNDKNFNRLKGWVAQGALLQMDLGAVVGQYGSEAAEAANAILENGLYHFIGTDLHRPRQCEKYHRPAWERLKKQVNRFDEKRHHRLI